VIVQRGMVLNYRKEDLDWVSGGSFLLSGEVLEQVAQTVIGCPISGGVQSQVG